jgi:AraC-like DNA-binding protein
MHLTRHQTESGVRCAVDDFFLPLSLTLSALLELRRDAMLQVLAALPRDEDYLTRVFNRELAISPWDYLNRYRILQAENLVGCKNLIRTDLLENMQEFQSHLQCLVE